MRERKADLLECQHFQPALVASVGARWVFLLVSRAPIPIETQLGTRRAGIKRKCVFPTRASVRPFPSSRCFVEKRRKKKTCWAGGGERSRACLALLFCATGVPPRASNRRQDEPQKVSGMLGLGGRETQGMRDGGRTQPVGRGTFLNPPVSFVARSRDRDRVCI